MGHVGAASVRPAGLTVWAGHCGLARIFLLSHLRLGFPGHSAWIFMSPPGQWTPSRLSVSCPSSAYGVLLLLFFFFRLRATPTPTVPGVLLQGEGIALEESRVNTVHWFLSWEWATPVRQGGPRDSVQTAFSVNLPLPLRPAVLACACDAN